MGNSHLVSKKALFDPTLSIKAKGLFSILSQNINDQNEVIDFAKMSSLSTNGRDSFRAAVRELMDRGYLAREQLKNSGGQFEGHAYRVYPLGRDPES